MSDAKAIMEMIKENDITYVDLRFTDPRGKMQHVTQHIDTIDEESLSEGFMFDGSSIAIDEPSNIKPSDRLSSSMVSMCWVTCCILPRGSVKRRST